MRSRYPGRIHRNERKLFLAADRASPLFFPFQSCSAKWAPVPMREVFGHVVIIDRPFALRGCVYWKQYRFLWRRWDAQATLVSDSTLRMKFSANGAGDDILIIHIGERCIVGPAAGRRLSDPAIEASPCARRILHRSHAWTIGTGDSGRSRTGWTADRVELRSSHERFRVNGIDP